MLSYASKPLSTESPRALPSNTQQVAIIAPTGSGADLALVPGCGFDIGLRAELTPDGMQQLVDAGIRLVIVDLRDICTTQIRPALRLLRLLIREVQIVAITAPNDPPSAQIAIASGALAQLGRGLSSLSLLRALNAVKRGAPSIGETGQYAIARMQREMAEVGL